MFFSFMQDKESLWQAAFTSADPSDLDAHNKHWERILNDPQILNRTILSDGVVVGSVGRYFMDGVAQVTYWIGSEFKNKGIATATLAKLVVIDQTRPMEARTAFDNAASARVLQKNGFSVVGTDKYFANARGEEIAETIWRLV